MDVRGAEKTWTRQVPPVPEGGVATHFWRLTDLSKLSISPKRNF